jgi:hypothetical protein
VPGAAVTFSAPGTSLSLLPCNTTTCIVATDRTGEADVWMVVKSTGSTTVRATIANGRNVSATVSGISGSLLLSAVPPRIYVAANTSASVPLIARVFGNGAALSGRQVSFDVVLGSGSLAASTATTDAAGEARSAINLVNFTAEVQVSACVGVSPNIACDIFYVRPVVVSGGVQMLESGGDGQYVFNDGDFSPVVVRVFDRSTPPNSVSGAPVHFHVDVYRVLSSTVQQAGEVLTGYNSQRIAIATSDVTAYSDGWGVASYTPQILASWGVVRIDIKASIVTESVRFTLHTLGTTPAGGGDSLRRARKVTE